MTEITEEELARSFPDVDPEFSPFGSRIIVQLRNPPYMMGRMLLPDETRETEMWNTQVGKVRAIGAGAFKNRDTGDIWPEGAWFKIGDYVRVPKFNQDKWFIKARTEFTNPYTKEKHECTDYLLFMLVRDVDCLAMKNGNPLEVKATFV